MSKLWQGLLRKGKKTHLGEIEKRHTRALLINTKETILMSCSPENGTVIKQSELIILILSDYCILHQEPIWYNMYLHNKLEKC